MWNFQLQNNCFSLSENLYISISKTSGKIYVKTKHEIFLQWNTNFFSSENSGPPTFWKLSRLYELCESCRRNPLETLEWKNIEQWRAMYLWLCYFAPVILKRYIKYILVHTSKLLGYLFNVHLIYKLF